MTAADALSHMLAATLTEQRLTLEMQQRVLEELAATPPGATRRRLEREFIRYGQDADVLSWRIEVLRQEACL